MCPAQVGISARLAHPHIVRTYGSVPGPPRCLVIELLTCSLADLFTPGPDGRPPDRLSYREALDICIGLVTGLTVLRSHNIVHGDLRRETVLIAGDMTAKVSDLGTARAMSEIGGGRTAAEPVQGHYCAPERVARAGNVMVVPYAWDVYSAAVLCMEVLTRERADAGRWPELLPRVAHGPLREALINAHRGDPEARPSAGVLLEALRGAAGGGEYDGCPPRRRVTRVDGAIRLL